MGDTARTVSAVGGLVVMLGWPFALNGALRFGGPRWAGIACLLAGLVLLLQHTLSARPRARRQARGRGHTVYAAAALMVAGAVGIVFGRPEAVLASPILISASLLVAFGGSLLTDTPIVERFARLQVADLTEPERRYCRHVTVAWCVFFVSNIVVTTALATFGPLWAWTLWVGALAYCAIGLLFAVEYLLRKALFGRLDPTFVVDRILSKVLPLKSDAS